MCESRRVQLSSVKGSRQGKPKLAWKGPAIIMTLLLVMSLNILGLAGGNIGSTTGQSPLSGHQLQQDVEPVLTETGTRQHDIEKLTSPSSSSSTNKLLNGTFKGIKYQHGNKTERYHGSFNQTFTDRINETHVRSEVTNQSLYLMENWSLINIIFKVSILARNLTDSTNSTFELFPNATEYFSEVVPFIYDGLINGTDPVNITEYAIDWAYIVDQNDTPLLQRPVNVSYFHFIKNNIEFDMYVQPFIFKVNLTLRLYHDIQVNTTEFLYVLAFINSTYELTYDVNISSVVVNIWHEPSLFLQVMGAGHYAFQFTELSATMVFYYIQALKVYQLTFANGTAVPWRMYPFELYPVNYTQQGISIEVTYQQGLIRGASIQQSIVQSYLVPRTSSDVTSGNETQNDGTPTNTSDSSRLALWLVQTIPTFIGFKDNNHNGILDLQFSVDDGITVGSIDRPVLFGNAEAQERSVFQYYQKYQKYNASFQILGLNINETVQNQENNDTFINVEVESIGDVDAFPEPQLTWNEPREVSNGSYEFNFSIFYDDVPVTWQRIDGSNVSATMDVGYNYVFTVSPNEKQARLSPTFYYGSVNLPIFSQPTVNISLSVPFLSEFLFLTPIQSLSGSQQDLNKSKAATIADVRLVSGNVTLGEVNASGTKSFYKVGSSTIKRMKTSAMHLVNVMGVFTRSEATEFSLGSDTFKVIKNAILDAARHNVSFALQYRSDIYLLNYPTWNGQEIVHDPTFSISYDAPPPSPENSGPEVVLPTPTFTFTLIPEQQQLQTTNPIVDVNDLPSGFAASTLVITMIGVILGLILSQGRKKLYL